MDDRRKFQAHPQSTPGDFYVIDNECLACGAPHVVAPDLIGWATVEAEEYLHCIWKKQPETPAEWQQAFMAFDVCEMECYRYAGSDPNAIDRIGYKHCDQAVVPESHKHKSLSGDMTWSKGMIAPVDIQLTLTASKLTRIGSAISALFARFSK